MTPQIVTRDIPMSKDLPTAEQVAAARAWCAQKRKEYGFNPDPDCPTHELKQSSAAALRLAEVIVAPLRMNLHQNTDRIARLAVRVDELVEEGFSTIEIRRHLDLIDAANDEDY